MTTQQAHALAREWVDAWNSHDIERILVHYADHIVMSSPYVTSRFGAGRTVRGREAARAYWTYGLQRVPDMTFRLIDVLVGVESLTIYYHTSLTNATVAEVLALGPDGRFTRGHAHYSEPNPPATEPAATG